ncbi:n-acetyllactosaminide beta-1,3-N-acetylglucosaminyltransferase 4 [Nephila pilipes]|uniref:Hexosyltransferase n=1 Tax=Nephila pilipes TaxID=299642 RepID=A0A8X6TEH2_NEPPI|nr:n-acetyllactosaminide beta-1,3-N-acetylglucosaminyltransferase 4 [Nephila pilipes]
MRRFWYAKYAVTLLASTALTFHLLYSGTQVKMDKEDLFQLSIERPAESKTSFSFTKSSSFLRRKLSQGVLATPHSLAVPPRWTVLPGNITVHEGDERIPIDISFEISAENLCEDYDKSRKMLLIFVASSADHFSQRKVIRETWGLKLLQHAYNYRIVFLLGKGSQDSQPLIEHEGYRYGDLVQINLTESFRNLGKKSMAGLLWSKNFCSKADFVMKTDDDILVHVPNLLKALEGSRNTDSLLMCHENRMRKILRKELLDRTDLPSSYHKYEVSRNELPGQYYPPYCSGMAYVFTSSVRDRLLDASMTTPIFFIEDVYLTGFCRHKAGIIIKPHSGITLRPPINFLQASCSFRDGRITSQEVGADELQLMWVELNTQGFFCPQLLGFANKRKEFDSSKENEISSL